MSVLASILPNREKTYLTQEGDVVDALCFNHYGSTKPVFVNAVYSRNPHIARLSKPVLPHGLLMVFPIVTKAAESVVIRELALWVTAPSENVVLQTVAAAVKAAEITVDPEVLAEELAEYRRLKKIKKIITVEEPPRVQPPTLPPYYYGAVVSDPFEPPLVMPLPPITPAPPVMPRR